MAGELVHRAHAVEKEAGVARSTRTVSFDGEVLTWADLPAQTRRAVRHSAPVVAELAVLDSGLRSEGTAVVQVLRAWRAHSDRLYTVVVARPVVVGERVLPVGPWAGRELRRFDTVGEPRRRVGWVPAGVRARTALSAAGAAPASVAAGPDKQGAAQAWPHLPQPVREGAERAVPLPEDWLGSVVQFRRPDGFPIRQEIVVLRRDEATAVVLRATRELEPAAGATRDAHDESLATADWLVEQVVYDLDQPRRLESSRLRRGPLWN